MRLPEILQRRYRGITHGFILHGVTSFESCAKDPQGTAMINVESVRNVIDDLVKFGITPVFASSDAVFDGSSGGRTEKDPANPITNYGHQKVLIENYLSEKCPGAIIVRISKILSTDPQVRDMLGEWINCLEAGATIRCAYDHIFSPADIEDIDSALVGLAEKNLSGLFHVCGPVPISRLDLLRTLMHEVERYRNIASQIIPCSLRDFNSLEPRPLNTSMSAEKLYSVLGVTFKLPQEICRVRAEAHYAKR
jgi:dTDP-4-dehydrorhamnose reductase